MKSIFLVGAAKAGTTSLYQILSRHPEVCSPVVKEPNYYSSPNGAQNIVCPGKGPGDNGTVWTATLEKYNALYHVGKKHRFRLDGSVSYLYSEAAAKRIAADHPDTRIIIVLRNPVDRAWSHYKHLIRDGREKGSFEEALEQEEERRRKGWEFSWHLKQMGLYSEQIERYLYYFGQDRIHFFLFEDLREDLMNVVQTSADFAGLPAFEFEASGDRDNISGVSRSKAAARFVNWLAGYKVQINKLVGPRVTHAAMQKFRTLNVREGEMKLSAGTRKMLAAWFDEDIGKTERLIGRDLSAWKNSPIHEAALR